MSQFLAPLSGWVGRNLFKAALLALLCALLLVGLVILGQNARDDLSGRGRYSIPFAEVVCNLPPGQARADFLEEVQYYGEVADPLRVLDDGLPPRLADAFARHPWVEKVEKVEVRPPRQVEVQLTFRRPVLAVRWNNQLRAVDGQGVLLPRSAPTEGLPV